MIEYVAIAILFGAAAGIAGGMILVFKLLGPKRRSATKETPFECGVDPFQLPSGKVAIKFYLVAMLFVIFDVELVFLFPWAVTYRELGMVGFVAMALFLAVVVAAYVYAWRRGALEWE